MKTESSTYSPPFELRVVKTLMRALNSLQKWLSSQQARFDFKAASEIVSEGVSASTGRRKYPDDISQQLKQLSKS